MGDTDFQRSARDQPGPRDWILDLYGSFVRDFGGWIGVADLLVLLSELGITTASGRSALSRMKRRGELAAESREGVRGYTLTPAAERWFADGTARIMDPAPASITDEWVLASFSVPEEGRRIRYQIRSRLEDLGFGQLAGGLMVAPARIADESVRALEAAGLSDHVDFWRSRHLGPRPLADIVAGAWDLEAIAGAYDGYLELVDELAGRPAPADDADAFVRYLQNVNVWRRLPFLDPGIPGSLLPDGWPSERARHRFVTLAAELRPAAWRHFVTIAATT